MNCYKTPKIFIFLIGSFFNFDFLQASNPENNSEKIAKIFAQLHEELLTDEKLDAMYKAYANKELTVEDVAYKIERDKQIRLTFNEVKQGVREVKNQLEVIQKKLNERS